MATSKHAWSFTYQFLVGVTPEVWRRMLRENRPAVDRRYRHRAAFLTAMSAINGVYRRREERRHGAAIERTPVAAAPIFVLGHWRSGTTHLHNLLVADDQFAYPTVFQASFPRTFLSTERGFSRLGEAFRPRTRVMDTMEFRFDLPQEDEFALCAATGRSPLLGQVFPRRAAAYDRYLSFEGVPAPEVEEWKRALVWFLRKLSYATSRPLVLKSPPHTARLRLLLDLFPDARFVHISRDPYAVFQSMRHMYDTMVWHTYLQAPDTAAVEGDILRRYNALYEAYEAQRALVPAGQLHELRYEDLARDPVGELRALYRALDIGGFARAEPRVRAYVAAQRRYRPNDHRALPEAMRERVGRAWRRSFDRWGYQV